ncbi:AAA family ATPase [Coleofasciculus sp. FACHB-SPT36]|uniref:McrB family protein n=1 Tax=Cyanophyceae TaxID=3028117 RepID=UPI00168B5C4F|nr:AAA family ATPase [Coleofasciculus sp. FACHB-SPT36]MBD2537779.1 AAA family ATPase [Coleofasciculus sp. FACHB-SPT36]
MIAEKRDEFVRLFQEFANSYPYTPPGLRHIAAYDEQRRQGRRNFEAIASAAESRENVTEAVLLQLLPYGTSANNRQRGAWIHIAPAITKDIKEWFEAAKWTKSEDWSQVAEAIFSFVRHCNNEPGQLSAACKEFTELPYSKGFQMGMLTPILNALRPDDFLLINNKSRQVINYFANTSYGQKLTDYPAANFTGHKLIKKLATEMHYPGVPALRDDDLFDMFSLWLVTIKKYGFLAQETSLASEVVEFTSDLEEVELQPEYTLCQCAEDTGLDQAELTGWVRAIERKKQAIIYGSPGTGKTFIAQKIAQHLIGGGYGFSELVQFHPAYTYEDFIQGIRPQSQDGQLKYSLVPGRFLEFCKKAESCQGLCVLIIDEINRANLAQVFGELMYLLEYRDKEIPLAGGNTFRIPPNVRIIGTMNTADRSIALVDHALRRRFAFIELRPNYEVLRRYHEKKTSFNVDKLIDVLKRLNNAIADKHYEIGISFFLTENLPEDIQDIWLMEIEPYLEEYFFDNLKKVDEFRWDGIKKELSL